MSVSPKSHANATHAPFTVWAHNDNSDDWAVIGDANTREIAKSLYDLTPGSFHKNVSVYVYDNNKGEYVDF